MCETDKKTIQLIKGKDDIAQILFTVAIILELIVMMSDHMSSWTLPFRGRVTHVAFLLLCIKILMSRYDYRQAAIIVLTGVMGIVSYFTCKDEYVIRVVVFVAAAIGADIRRNLSIIFWGTLAGTLIIIVLALFGICGKVVDIRHYGRGMVEARYCLGFNHANNVHCMMWYIVSLLVLLKHDALKVFHYIALFAINLGLYLFTASRTGVMATSIILIMAVLIKQYNTVVIKRTYLGGAFLSLAACIIISLRSATVLPVYDNYQMKLNSLLTGRLEMVWEYAPLSTWALFPGARTSGYVDNGFVSITYLYGTLVGVVFCILIAQILYDSYKNDKLSCLIVMTSCIFVVFMESTYIFNVSLLCNMVLLLKIGVNNYE